jgi:hypothetical protein
MVATLLAFADAQGRGGGGGGGGGQTRVINSWSTWSSWTDDLVSCAGSTRTRLDLSEDEAERAKVAWMRRTSLSARLGRALSAPRGRVSLASLSTLPERRTNANYAALGGGVVVAAGILRRFHVQESIQAEWNDALVEELRSNGGGGGTTNVAQATVPVMLWEMEQSTPPRATGFVEVEFGLPVGWSGTEVEMTAALDPDSDNDGLGIGDTGFDGDGGGDALTLELSLAAADGQPLVELARNRDGTITSSGGVVTLVFAFPVELLQGIGAGVDAPGTAAALRAATSLRAPPGTALDCPGTDGRAALTVSCPNSVLGAELGVGDALDCTSLDTCDDRRVRSAIAADLARAVGDDACATVSTDSRAPTDATARCGEILFGCMERSDVLAATVRASYESSTVAGNGNNARSRHRGKAKVHARLAAVHRPNA